MLHCGYLQNISTLIEVYFCCSTVEWVYFANVNDACDVTRCHRQCHTMPSAMSHDITTVCIHCRLPRAPQPWHCFMINCYKRVGRMGEKIIPTATASMLLSCLHSVKAFGPVSAIDRLPRSYRSISTHGCKYYELITVFLTRVINCEHISSWIRSTVPCTICKPTLQCHTLMISSVRTANSMRYRLHATYFIGESPSLWPSVFGHPIGKYISFVQA